MKDKGPEILLAFYDSEGDFLSRNNTPRDLDRMKYIDEIKDMRRKLTHDHPSNSGTRGKIDEDVSSRQQSDTEDACASAEEIMEFLNTGINPYDKKKEKSLINWNIGGLDDN